MIAKRNDFGVRFKVEKNNKPFGETELAQLSKKSKTYIKTHIKETAI